MQQSPRHDEPALLTAFIAGQLHFMRNQPLATMPLLDEYRAARFVAGYEQELNDAADTLLPMNNGAK